MHIHRNWIFLVILVLVLAGGGLFYRYRANAADARGATLLMRAFEEPELDKANLLRLIRNERDINVRDNDGNTALFYALRHTQDKVLIRKMLDRGADLSAADHAGYTPLMVAAQENNSEDIMRELLARGAPVNRLSDDGNSALLLAARHNSPQVVRALLRAGADPDVKNAAGQTVFTGLADNKQFSAEEKNNYRQAMIVAAILGPWQKH